MKAKFDVFVSYRGPERKFVFRRLVLPLRNANLSVAIDFETFGFGAWNLENIRLAVERSRYTLLAITPAWHQSEWCEAEMQLTRHLDPAAKRQRIIPVILAETHIPECLRFLHYCDLSSQKAYECNFQKLVNTLRSKRGGGL